MYLGTYLYQVPWTGRYYFLEECLSKSLLSLLTYSSARSSFCLAWPRRVGSRRMRVPVTLSRLSVITESVCGNQTNETSDNHQSNQSYVLFLLRFFLVFLLFLRKKNNGWCASLSCNTYLEIHIFCSVDSQHGCDCWFSAAQYIDKSFALWWSAQ